MIIIVPIIQPNNLQAATNNAIYWRVASDQRDVVGRHAADLLEPHVHVVHAPSTIRQATARQRGVVLHLYAGFAVRAAGHELQGVCKNKKLSTVNISINTPVAHLPVVRGVLHGGEHREVLFEATEWNQSVLLHLLLIQFVFEVKPPVNGAQL